MVGYEEDNGDQFGYLPGVHICPKCGRLSSTRAGILECRHPALEGQPRPDDADAEDQASAEARTEARLYDAWRSGKVSLESPPDPTLGKVFLDRLVHGLTAIGDNGPKMVDGES
jgi:hypothetical protein